MQAPRVASPQHSTRLKLYRLTEDLDRLALDLVANDGEITPELAARIDELHGDAVELVPQLLQGALELEAESAAIKAEAARLGTLAGARKNAAERLRHEALRLMRESEIDRIVSPLGTICRRANSRPTIRWTSPVEDLPEEFRRIETKVDGETAQAFLREMGSLPDGFEVFYGDHIVIR